MGHLKNNQFKTLYIFDRKLEMYQAGHGGVCSGINDTNHPWNMGQCGQ